MFFICICAFATFFSILQLSVDNDAEVNYVNEKLGMPFIDSLIMVYMIALGEFGFTDNFVGQQSKVAWVVFILATFMLLVVLLNMLIAVMADPFAYVNENRKMFMIKQRIELILDHISKVDLVKEFKDMKYIIIVKPEEMEVSISNRLDKTVVEMKNNVQR